MPIVNQNRGLNDLMNASRSISSPNYQSLVPELNDTNFREYAAGVLSNPETRNEWAQNLINRIGLVVIKRSSFENPLAFLKKGMLDMGDTVEELYTDLIKAQRFEPVSTTDTAGEIYKSAIPDMYAVFHKINREDVFEMSISHVELERAFVSPRALTEFINSTIERIITSDNVAEFEYMKQLLKVYEDNGLFYEVPITTPTDTTSVNLLLEQVKAFATKFTFMSRKYNAFNVMNNARREDQVLFISAELDAKIDVQSLASAFNLDKIEFLPRKIVLDEMPGGDTSHLILASREVFMMHDKLIQMTDVYNPKSLEYKYFYHHQSVLSMSRFENAILFTSKEVKEPSEITLTSSATGNTIKAGHIAYFSSVVKTGEGEDATSEGVNQAVMYRVIGNDDVNTTINDKGMLSVGTNEKGTIKVVSSSLHFADIKAEITLTISE